MNSPGPIVAVVGATATGKSDLAIDLATLLSDDGPGAEIINADAMQLYRGMDIGTAKVPLVERRGIPHHLLDVLDVTEEASVAAYQRDARSVIAQVRASGRIPVLVGGSGLYVRAALDHLEIPPTDTAVRASYQELLEQVGTARLYALLEERDPAAAAVIEPRNGRRIVRALEVIELTGRPFSATMPRREYVAAAVQVGLRRSRPELDERVDARVVRMWSEGLLEEVRSLVRHGLRDGFTASRAIGYAQALAQLDGTVSEGEAIAQTQQATRRLIRRQESWFGADPRIRWFDAGATGLPSAIATLIRDNGAHD